MTNLDNNFEGKTVLLVEDDSILSRLYQEKLEFEGFSVQTAYRGDQVLTIALQKNIDIILLDVGLPDTSGLDVLQKIRKEEKTKDIPVIVLTNQVDKKDKDKALKLNAKEYLVKAMQTPEEVVEKIKLALQ